MNSIQCDAIVVTTHTSAWEKERFYPFYYYLKLGPAVWHVHASIQGEPVEIIVWIDFSQRCTIVCINLCKPIGKMCYFMYKYMYICICTYCNSFVM